MKTFNAEAADARVQRETWWTRRAINESWAVQVGIQCRQRIVADDALKKVSSIHYPLAECRVECCQATRRRTAAAACAVASYPDQPRNGVRRISLSAVVIHCR